MQSNQYNSQSYYQSSKLSPPLRSNNVVWIIARVVTATLVVSALIALVLILIINGTNQKLEYQKVAEILDLPGAAATIPSTVANASTTPALPTPVTTSTAKYELPVSPLAGRLILNEADDQHILDGMPKFGFKNGRYELYRVDLNKDISAGWKVRDFYYNELLKLGWTYNGKRSNDTDNIYIFEKGKLNTFVIPLLVGYDLKANIYSYAGVKNGDSLILVFTGEYEAPKPTPTNGFQNPTPTIAPSKY